MRCGAHAPQRRSRRVRAERPRRSARASPRAQAEKKTNRRITFLTHGKNGVRCMGKRGVFSWLFLEVRLAASTACLVRNCVTNLTVLILLAKMSSRVSRCRARPPPPPPPEPRVAPPPPPEATVAPPPPPSALMRSRSRSSRRGFLCSAQTQTDWRTLLGISGKISRGISVEINRELESVGGSAVGGSVGSISSDDSTPFSSATLASTPRCPSVGSRSPVRG